MNPKLIAKVARQLLMAYTRQTAGAPVKWSEASPETRKVWIRLARIAVIASTEPAPAGAEA